MDPNSEYCNGQIAKRKPYMIEPEQSCNEED